MPIIESISAEQPLSQGDLLKGLNLFATARGWNADGGSSTDIHCQLCLVISRPCNCKNKKKVIVLAIDKYTGDVPKNIDKFDKIRRFLEGVRDGHSSPDVFYVGEIEGNEGRFAARLDSFHTIEIPNNELDLANFVKDRRIGRLHIDFIRELHARIFRAFANLGFDDFGWLTDKDLEWLIRQGNAEIHEAKAAQHGVEAGQSAKEFGARQPGSGEIEKAETRLSEIEAELAPYIAEQDKRRPQ